MTTKIQKDFSKSACDNGRVKRVLFPLRLPSSKPSSLTRDSILPYHRSNMTVARVHKKLMPQETNPTQKASATEYSSATIGETILLATVPIRATDKLRPMANANSLPLNHSVTNLD